MMRAAGVLPGVLGVGLVGAFLAGAGLVFMGADGKMMEG
jgi:hypothetical protein